VFEIAECEEERNSIFLAPRHEKHENVMQYFYALFTADESYCCVKI